MDLGLRDKVALVCAASKGLGRATAEVLAGEGARVVICARTESDLREARDAIQAATGGAVEYRTCDLSHPEEVTALVEGVLATHGRVDVLVHNAGGPPPGAFVDVSIEQWQAALELNFLSAVRLCRAVLPSMRAQHWGRVIFITSVSVKQPLENLVLSNSTRLGVAGLAKTLAREHGDAGVLVNVVCPGPTATARMQALVRATAEREGIPEETVARRWTDDIPVGRLGDPVELAHLIAFLASKRASYITGTVIPVDGGYAKSSL